MLVDAKSMPRWTALFEEIGKADPDMIGRELGRASGARILGDLERAEDAVQGRLYQGARTLADDRHTG